MQYRIENEKLRLTVDSKGAEMVSLVNKATGAEMLWQADPAVWNRHAPLLFPYTGRLKEGKFTWKDKEYPGAAHGFGRDLEHVLTGQSDDTLTLEARDSEATRRHFPFAFVLRSSYRLEGCRLLHTVAVENPGDETLRFGFGFHPGFVCPFDEEHCAADYDLKFDTPQSPVLQLTPGGLCGGTEVLMENSDALPLSDTLFSADSLCMTQLTAHTLSLVERDSGRAVRVNIEGFPYVLAWSAATEHLRFVCIEPWHSLPDRLDASGRWEDKPCAAALAPGERWSTCLKMEFCR